MMKKILYCAIFLTSCVYAQDSQDIDGDNALPISGGLINFVQDFQQYYPHPDWVVKSMMHMSFADAKEIFLLLSSLVSDNVERWYYLYDKQDQFKNDFIDATIFIEHFKKYNNYFERLALTDDGGFKLFDQKIYHEQSFEVAGCTYTPFLATLKAVVQEDFVRFYATYYSYLSSCYVDLVKDCYNTHDMSAKLRIDEYFFELCNVYFNCLRDTSVEARANQALMQYYGLWTELGKK